MRCYRLALTAVVLLSACASKVQPLAQPVVTPQMRMALADTEVRAGCLDCLEAAFAVYTALQSDSSVGPAAAEAAARAAVLMAVRENELGLIDSGRAQQARGLVTSPSEALSTFLDMGDALSSKPAGFSRGGVSDGETMALARISRSQLGWASTLRGLIPDDLAADYLWLSLVCGEYGFNVPDRADRRTILGDSIDVPLVAYKNASTCSINRASLQEILDRDPRFIEANYYLGINAIAGQPLPGAPPRPPDLEGADERFRTAYAWRQNWPSLTLSIANLALTAEDFDRAFEFFEKTLTLIPEQPDALMGSIRALTYLGRYIEAIAAADRLLATNRNPGEARYWRALNHEQLQHHDDAWSDIERAAAALVNADVPKLAGIIAINRQQLDVARQRLELSLRRRSTDCETNFYLQVVLSEQRQWQDAARVSATTATCFDAAILRLSNEIESLRVADMPPERRARQIARREQEIAGDTRRRATSWFNAAAANFNLARADEARGFAAKLLDDEQFGDRARAIIDRLSPP